MCKQYVIKAQNKPQQSKFNQFSSNGDVPHLFLRTVATATGGGGGDADDDARVDVPPWFTANELLLPPPVIELIFVLVNPIVFSVICTIPSKLFGAPPPPFRRCVVVALVAMICFKENKDFAVNLRCVAAPLLGFNRAVCFEWLALHSSEIIAMMTEAPAVLLLLPRIVVARSCCVLWQGLLRFADNLPEKSIQKA